MALNIVKISFPYRITGHSSTHGPITSQTNAGELQAASPFMSCSLPCFEDKIPPCKSTVTHSVREPNAAISVDATIPNTQAAFFNPDPPKLRESFLPAGCPFA